MDERDDRTERYLVSYADMVTLLVGVFVVLSTTFRADAERYRRISAAAASVFGSRSAPVDSVPLTPITAVFRKLSPTDIEHDSITYRCILADEVLFESGSSALSPKAEQALDELATLLRDGPPRSPLMAIPITDHHGADTATSSYQSSGQLRSHGS